MHTCEHTNTKQKNKMLLVFVFFLIVLEQLEMQMMRQVGIKMEMWRKKSFNEWVL